MVITSSPVSMEHDVEWGDGHHF